MEYFSELSLLMNVSLVDMNATVDATNMTTSSVHRPRLPDDAHRVWVCIALGLAFLLLTGLAMVPWYLRGSKTATTTQSAIVGGVHGGDPRRVLVLLPGSPSILRSLVRKLNLLPILSVYLGSFIGDDLG